MVSRNSQVMRGGAQQRRSDPCRQRQRKSRVSSTTNHVPLCMCRGRVLLCVFARRCLSKLGSATLGRLTRIAAAQRARLQQPPVEQKFDQGTHTSPQPHITFKMGRRQTDTHAHGHCAPTRRAAQPTPLAVCLAASAPPCCPACSSGARLTSGSYDDVLCDWMHTSCCCSSSCAAPSPRAAAPPLCRC